jgi:hypothetical protein
MPKDCFSKRRRDNKVLQIDLRSDKGGLFIPYCAYEKHPGILFNGEYKKCQRRRCPHYFRFRPDSDLEYLSQ